MSAASLSTLSFSLSFLLLLLLLLFLQRRTCACVHTYAHASAYEAERTGEKRKGNAATHETKGVSRLARRRRFFPTFLSRLTLSPPLVCSRDISVSFSLSSLSSFPIYIYTRSQFNDRFNSSTHRATISTLTDAILEARTSKL